ncbi:MAG: ABC transporter ATP-binding protein [Oligoflexia bacterium]|nr:ABC transporter ATP-binding protein [Oligoflexia bacterium]
MIVEAKQLYKTFMQGGYPVEVLSGLDLQLESGETVAIVGQSGNGKSTLLSLLAGLDSPTKGTVEVAGQELGAMTEEELAIFRSRNVGIIFQQFHLMSNLTAIENVSLPLEIMRTPEAYTKAAIALERVGLGHRKTHFPYQLSGGEKQRVAIARALVINPKLLLADEPSGSLDAKTGDQVMKLLFGLVKESGTTMLLVTHNDALVRLCSRALLMRDGKLFPYQIPD